MKITAWMCLLLLSLTCVAAYQQSYLQFDLDSSQWKIVEQRHAMQTFRNGNLIFAVSSSHTTPITVEQYASSFDGKVLSTAQYDVVSESVVQTSEVIIYALAENKGEYYSLIMIAPIGELTSAKSEMQKIYPTLTFVTTPLFITAPWEQELKDPPELGFLQTHKIPWLIIVLVLLVLCILILFIRRKSKGKHKGTVHPSHHPIHHRGETHKK